MISFVFPFVNSCVESDGCADLKHEIRFAFLFFSSPAEWRLKSFLMGG